MLNSGVSLQRLATKAGVGFTPKKLFSNGEAGVWYDPSDVEASLTWRRNLHEYSESFSLWTKQVSVITEDVIAGPYENTLADKFVANSAVNTAWVLQDQPIVRGQTYTQTIFAKAGEVSWLQIAPSTAFNTGHQNYNLATGELGTNTSGIGNVASIENIGNGWYRCSLSTTSISTTSAGRFAIGWIGGDDGRLDSDATVTPDGVKGVYIWGAQIEQSSTATEYQPIRTTFDNAFKQAFPKHTLYQDHNGQTPVTALGQSVGLMLDKSQGVAFGDEEVTNGGFDSASNWTIAGADAASNISNGVAYIESAGTNAYVTQQLTGVTAGKVYRLSFNLVSEASSDTTDGLAYVRFAGVDVAHPIGQRKVGVQSYIFTAGSGSQELRFMTYAHDGASFTIDDVSVKEVSGSHATQSNSTKRPVFARHPERGRVNLFKYTEEFDNGFWSKYAVTLTTNATTAPDGTNTASRIVATASNNTHQVQFTNNYGTDTFTQSIYAKAGEYSYLVINGLQSGDFTYFNLSNGTIGNIHSAHSNVTMTDVGNGWYRCSVTHAGTNNGAGFGVAENNGAHNFTGDGTSGIYIWGAQLEVANEATGYQKVVDDYDITESGYKSVYYLQFDGVNDLLLINNLTSSATPLTAMFGFKDTAASSSTTYLLDIETGRTIFAVGNNQIHYYDGGWSAFDQDLTDRLVATFDTATNDAQFRVNGITEDTDNGWVQRAISGGVGLFGHYNGGARMQGNLYQCVVRAATSTDKEIDQAEEFVAIKTGLKSEVAGLATLDLNFGANTYTARNSNGSVL